MRRVPVSRLRPGDVVGVTIRNERGDILLREGVTLTAELIASLQRRRHFAVYVRDGIVDDVIPHDIVSERVRAVTIRHISDLFELGPSLNGESQPARKAVRLREHRIHRLVERVRADVDLILNEVLDRDTITGITALKSYDDYTFSHSVDVAVVAILIGRTLRLGRDELNQLALGSLLHDIGKMFIPEAILNKPGPLTDEEMATMQSHTVRGFQYLVEHEIGDFVANHIAFQHHERQDGTGYPRGLRGTNRLRRGQHDWFNRERIHPLAEIAAVADVYSALASDRPYRAAMAPEQVATVIRQMAGHHLNQEVVAAFALTIPVFPIGAPVRLEGGRYDGYQGVVVENRPGALDRPVVRLTSDAQGHLLEPDDFDTAFDPDCRLVTPPASLAAPLSAVG
ncbi:MAG: HD-GYP domain-containing protein [Chloroflexi bacterium]|nr:HD-GYP domain-containing protein [Chloroflexota bacterium]